MRANDRKAAEIEAVAEAIAPGIPGLAVTAGASEQLAKRAINALDEYRAENGIVPPHMKEEGYCDRHGVNRCDCDRKLAISRPLFSFKEGEGK